MQWVRRSAVSTPIVVAAAASIGAGLVHAAAAGSHNDDTSLAWIFAVCAVAQLAWAGIVIARPQRIVLAAGVALNGACALAWLLSRTVGLLGPLGGIEDVGTQDLLAAILGTIAAFAALAALLGHRRRLDIPAAFAAVGLVVVLAVPAMAAEHTHSAVQVPSDLTAASAVGHTHTDTASAAHDHSSTAATSSDPIITISDPRLTKDQRQRALTLLDGTRAALAAFPSEDSLIAAGYRSIGDGRKVGSFEHFVNSAYMADGNELDPLHIESIVTQLQDDGTKKIVSAMYILEPGATLATVPEIAGDLTSWHNHDNLCWQDGKVVGLYVAGKCLPRGQFLGVTPPMIHVWLEDTPCGPFTGIEGHGGSNCTHSHTSA
jgi:hypothetical protein